MADGGGSSSVFSSASCASSVISSAGSMMNTRRAASNGRYPTTSQHPLAQRLDLDRRLVALSMTSTSECWPRAMRWHVEHAPHASSRPVGARGQFTACASAIATARLPTPSGPGEEQALRHAPAADGLPQQGDDGPWPMTGANGMDPHANRFRCCTYRYGTGKRHS